MLGSTQSSSKNYEEDQLMPGLGLASISLAFAFGQLWWGLTQPVAGIVTDLRVVKDYPGEHIEQMTPGVLIRVHRIPIIEGDLST